MTTIVTLKGARVTLPKEVCQQAHLHKGKKIIIETSKDGSIRIKLLKENAAGKRLKELLKHPYNMGKMFVKTRQDIYDDID